LALHGGLAKAMPAASSGTRKTRYFKVPPGLWLPLNARASRKVCQTVWPGLDLGATRVYCPVMLGLRLKAAIWLVALATAATGQPAPSSRFGGWLDVGVSEWYGPYGQIVAGQMWGRRVAEDGVRLIEAFTLSRSDRDRDYSRVRLDVVAPLGSIGSFRLGASSQADFRLLDPEVSRVDIAPSAGLTLNADDWDFMVAPDEMTYRGPGLKLNVNYGIGDLLDPPSKLGHSVSLAVSAPWTVRFDKTRLEVGPSVMLYTRNSGTMGHSESRSLGGQVLLAGGSRLVDVLVASEYYAADGPGYELSASASHWTYRESDTLRRWPDYLYVKAQARAADRVWRQFYAQPELVVLMDKNDNWPDWTPRLRPSVALARLWTVRPGCVLAAQVGATLPIGFHPFAPFVYNEEVALDARVGLCGNKQQASR